MLEAFLPLASAATFARHRWGLRFADRPALLRFQSRQLETFLNHALPRAPFYRRWAGQPFSALPVVDKSTVLADFAAFNTRGLALAPALEAGLRAERSRDFSPTLDGLTVGLSSGTSGTRGVFLVSREERARWAGVLLARLLSESSLRQLLAPWRQPLRVAFFLRANSNLYETVGSRRLDFAYHDLLEPLERHLERLSASPPDVLVAPPTVLRRLADADLRISPRQVLSVAEVLEPDDERRITAAFGVPVAEVYQCTEGFLGASCPAGRVHLNEELVHVEPEWLDASHTRFHPIVTDFSRTTQLIVRYRLDDVLRIAESPCPCGRPTLSLDAILGRADDVLWAPPVDGPPGAPAVAVFPDVLRHAFARADPAGTLRDYRLEQHGGEWRIRLDAPAPSLASLEVAVRAEILDLTRRLALRLPALRFEPWRDEPLDQKRRRIRCLEKPDGKEERP